MVRETYITFNTSGYEYIMNKTKPNAVVIGYTLDSAILARELAQKGNKQVTYLKTGRLGYPLDDLKDYISYEDVINLNTLGVDVEYRKLINGSYVFMPYDALKFVNNRNGLLSYPLNKSSFDSAEEWEQLEFCLHKLSEFRETLEDSTNFINIYKNFFPKWLYDSLLKYMGINKWGKIRQSQFSREALAKEINLSYLDSTNTGTAFKPVNGYEDICNRLLNHPNIKIGSIQLDDIRKILIKRHVNSDIIVCDNRIDYICNYTYGNFDRVQFRSEPVIERNLEEFIDISEGVVITPMKDYWCISADRGDITKLYSTAVQDLKYTKQSDIPMTLANKKMYAEYKKMLTLYSGKILDLDSRVVTIIK